MKMQRILPPRKEQHRAWIDLPWSGEVHDLGCVGVNSDRPGHGWGGPVLTVVRVPTPLSTVVLFLNQVVAGPEGD